MVTAIKVGFILAFTFLLIGVFAETLDRFFPDNSKQSLGSYGALLGVQEESKLPMRNYAMFFGYFILGFVLVLLALYSIEAPFLSNIFAWPGLWLIVASGYVLKYSSIYSILGGVTNPPVWTLVIQWIQVVGIFLLAYRIYKTHDD